MFESVNDLATQVQPYIEEACGAAFASGILAVAGVALTKSGIKLAEMRQTASNALKMSRPNQVLAQRLKVVGLTAAEIVTFGVSHAASGTMFLATAGGLKLGMNAGPVLIMASLAALSDLPATGIVFAELRRQPAKKQVRFKVDQRDHYERLAFRHEPMLPPIESWKDRSVIGSREPLIPGSFNRRGPTMTG